MYSHYTLCCSSLNDSCKNVFHFLSHARQVLIFRSFMRTGFDSTQQHSLSFPHLSRCPSIPVLDEYFTAAIKAYSLSQHASLKGHHKNWSRLWRIAKIQGKLTNHSQRRESRFKLMSRNLYYILLFLCASSFLNMSLN
jgi:hypothetical protein